MATKAQVERALEKVGGRLISVGQDLWQIEAPAGFIWLTDNHTVTEQYAEADGSKADFWADVLEDVRAGLTECNGWQDQIEDTRPCEWCASDGIIKQREA